MCVIVCIRGFEALHHVCIPLRPKVPTDEPMLNLLVNDSTLCMIPSMTIESQVPEDLVNPLCKRKSICIDVWTKGTHQTRMHKEFRTIRVIETMMSSPFGPAQSEGLCLRYPESAGLHREISLENAVNMLGRAAQVAQTVPFTWGYIDKPNGKHSP